jgi:hypothetical protein
MLYLLYLIYLTRRARHGRDHYIARTALPYDSHACHHDQNGLITKNPSSISSSVQLLVSAYLDPFVVGHGDVMQNVGTSQSSLARKLDFA